MVVGSRFLRHGPLLPMFIILSLVWYMRKTNLPATWRKY